MPVNADTLRAMMAAGLSGEALASVVEAVDRQMYETSPRVTNAISGADRTRKWRESKASERDESGDVTPSRPLPLKKSPTPPKKITPTHPTSGRSRRQAAPADKTARQEVLAQRKAEREQAEEFHEQFWREWPKERRENKAESRKAFAKAIARGPATAAQIIAAAKTFALKSLGKDAEFLPHPATWLNKERYLNSAEDAAEVEAAKVRAVPKSGDIGAGGKTWLHSEDPRFEAWCRHLKKRTPTDRHGGWLFDGPDPPQRPPSFLPPPS